MGIEKRTQKKCLEMFGNVLEIRSKGFPKARNWRRCAETPGVIVDDSESEGDDAVRWNNYTNSAVLN